MASVARSDATPVSPLKFFALTYCLSWVVWIPLDLSHFGIGPFSIPEGTSAIIRLLGVVMPAVAALILTGRSGGRRAVGALLGRLGIWRVGWKWWAAAVAVCPLLLLLTGLAYNRFSGSSPLAFTPQETIAAFVVSTVFLLIATLGEEIGWRGVALPGLQGRWSALVASLILALGWGLWHLPFWLLLDSFHQFGLPYLALNLAFVLPITLYITWFYNHGKFSLLLPVAFHLSFNILNTAILPVTMDPGAYAIFIALTWIITFLIVDHLEPERRRSRSLVNV
jgi:membrane protease YdiL (CAAX protease family)